MSRYVESSGVVPTLLSTSGPTETTPSNREPIGQRRRADGAKATGATTTTGKRGSRRRRGTQHIKNTTIETRISERLRYIRLQRPAEI
eukprot:2022798-Pyramimonas_sp.AAC.1